MAWTPPTTRATGDLITAAIWNADIVENLKTLDAFAYQTGTGNVGATGASEGAATTVITAPAFTADGLTPVEIQFRCIRWNNQNSTSDNSLWLYQDGTSIGQIWQGAPANTRSMPGISAGAIITPASGSRTYSIRASCNGGTFNLDAGAGGTGVAYPMYIRIVGAP